MKSNQSKFRKARMEPRRAVFCPPSYMYMPYVNPPPYYYDKPLPNHVTPSTPPPIYQRQQPAQVFPQLSDQIDISLPSFAPDFLFDYSHVPSCFSIVDRNHSMQ